MHRLKLNHRWLNGEKTEVIVPINSLKSIVSGPFNIGNNTAVPTSRVINRVVIMVQHLADIRSLKAVTSMRMISTQKCLKTRQPLAPYCLFKCSDEIQPTQLMLWIPVMNSSHLSHLSWPSPCAGPASIFVI